MGSPPSPPPNPTPPLQVSLEVVSKALLSFSQASGPGPSEERAVHLQACIKCPNSSLAQRALYALTAMVNIFLSGKAPMELSGWLGGAKLFALNKKDPKT